MSITISGYTAHGAWRADEAVGVRFRALAPVAVGEAQSGRHTLTFDAHVDDEVVRLEGDYARPTPSGTPIRTALSGSGERLVVDPG